jgi:hypothetical protein
MGNARHRQRASITSGGCEVVLAMALRTLAGRQRSAALNFGSRIECVRVDVAEELSDKFAALENAAICNFRIVPQLDKP